MALEGRHMDIVEMDGASSRKIDDIRDLIEQTKYKPALARYKIFIIDEVHMLTKEAFNALLKTLEEPPSYVKFILATTDPLKLPATILSRTQHFRFKNIAQNKVVEHLAHILQLEGIGYEHEALEILARSGGGSLRDTLTLLDQAIIYSKNNVDVTTVTDMLGLVDPKFLAEIFNAIFSQDQAEILKYVKMLEDYESEMVVDELIAYLKERMYNQDALFSTLILERFFRILSDAKYLFSINADGSFVLSLIFFKMVEALRIREIDQMIDALHKEITPSPLKIKINSTTPEMSPKPISQVVTQIPKSELIDPEAEKFMQLIAKISDRNAQLGECFREKIRFISYENDLLTWESCVDELCKKALTHGYAIIKQLVREVYGFETQIKHVACSKTPQQPMQNEPTQDSIESNLQTPIDAHKEHKEEENLQNMQSVTMIEEAEVGIGSCVSGCSQETPLEAQNGVDITQEPMVQKAIELFEAKKVTVQSKI